MPILAELLEILQLNNNQHCVSTRPVIELTTTTTTTTTTQQLSLGLYSYQPSYPLSSAQARG
jgi:hypothetical protein